MGDARQKGSFPPEAPTPGASVTSGDSAGRDEGSQDRPKRAKRSFLTQNACTRCRSKKSKCDGRRPVCERCEKHGTDCVYDVAQEGLTRMQNLQQQLEVRTADHRRMQSLFNMLQSGSDQEATTLLARLRMGATIEQLTAEGFNAPSMSLQDSTSFSQPQSQQQQHQQGQSVYTASWAGSPMTDQADWGWARSRSMSISSSMRDVPQGIPPRAYYDPNQSQPQPHELASPYFFSMAERYGLQDQDTPDGEMQWQDHGDMQQQPPSGYPEPQGPSSQMPDGVGQLPDGPSSRPPRSGRQPGGSQKRKA